MPGKYGVIDTAYTPITYDEWMKPLVAMTQQHMAAEESINALDTQNALMAQYINPQDDPEAWARWSAYSEGLNSASDYLARNGISPQMRREILDLNKQYNLKVKPIETAYNSRAAQIEAQEKAGPDELWERDARTISLDEYLANPKGPGIRHYNGADITKAVMDSMKNLREQIINDKDHAGYWYSILGGQYFERLVKHGYTDRDIVEIMTGNGRGPKALRTILNNELAKTGILDWAEPGSREYGRAVQYALAGLTGAVGKGDFTNLTDRSWEASPQDVTQPSDYLGYQHNPNPIYTPEEQDFFAKTVDEFLHYFTPTEKGYELNEDGCKRLQEDLTLASLEKNPNLPVEEYGKANPTRALAYSAQGDSYSKAGFVKFIDALNSFYEEAHGYKLDLDVSFEDYADKAGKLLTALINDKPDLWTDSRRFWEYTYSATKANREEMKDRIVSALGDSDVRGVRFNKDEGRYVHGDKSSTFSRNDILDVGDINMSSHGIVVDVTVLDKGNKSNEKKTRMVRIELPKNVNTSEYSVAAANLQKAADIKKELAEGRYSDTGREISEAERLSLKDLYEIHIDAAYGAIARMFETNKTKPSETQGVYPLENHDADYYDRLIRQREESIGNE